MSYMHDGYKWDRNGIVINNIFAFQVALDLIRNDEDPEPQNVEEWRNRNDWPKWKEAIHVELNLLMKRDAFRPVVVKTFFLYIHKLITLLPKGY